MPSFEQVFGQFVNSPAGLPFVAWIVFWRGFALWKAASKRQLIWFIVILVVNTLGILEIVYVFFLYKFDIDGGKALQFLKKTFKRKEEVK